MVGGPIGLAVGLVCGVTVWVVLGRTEDPAVVRRREAARRRPADRRRPACLLPGRRRGSRVCARVGQPGPRWSRGGGVPRHPSPARGRRRSRCRSGARWQPIRSSGTSVVPSVGRTRPEHPWGRRCTGWPRSSVTRARADVEERARSIEVKAAAPLGLCLLPAFVVLGVVPMVAGVFGSMDLLRMTSNRPQTTACAPAVHRPGTRGRGGVPDRETSSL